MAANCGVSRGSDYAYLYPGLLTVVQAAGRVIRTTSDEGVVYLIDDRFTRADIQALFPAWWEVRHHKARCSPQLRPDRFDRAEKDFHALDAP